MGPKVRAPFAYYGGKKKMAHKLALIAPEHCVFVEAFAGGAGLFWGKGRPTTSNNDHYREVLNDTNHAVVDVYRALRDHGAEVRRRIALLPYGEVEYRRAAQVYAGKQCSCLAERAAYLLLYWSCSFGGKGGGGLKRGRTSENPAMTWANKEALVDAWTSRLRGVYVEDLDYSECMSRWDTPGTLHYLDPPYLGANQGHYNGWGQEDQRNMMEHAATMKGAVMISGYFDPWSMVYAQDRRWAVHSIRTSVSAGREKAARTELLIVKPRTEEVGATQSKYLQAINDFKRLEQ
tara:strand:- start:173 stop:1045 length:873 start_codon:yes stop_codon:yes gene_type:complete